MRNINARVPGLVNFLDLFTDGRAPDTLSGVVQPVIDLERYYRIGKRERLVDIAPVVGIPAGLARLNFNTFQPGPNELWLVDHFSVEWGSVATRVAGYASVFPLSGPNPIDIALGQVGDNGGNGVAMAVASAPFIMPPGFVLRGLTTQNPAGATLTGSASILFTRVRL